MISSWTLRHIVREDLDTIIGWIPSEAALKCWAGPGWAWPIDADALWTQVDLEESLPLVMATDHDVMAFGQILQQEPGMLHVSLLVVNPEFRGRRLGERICLALFKRGMSHWMDASHVTLDVCRDDKAALAMTRRLGFMEQEDVQEDTAGRIRLIHELPELLG
ncbi:GNAT family N-acetyltransferase [Zymobacter sp. IVIA_12111.31 C1]|uniref:GNAT family N-acetyltransferase n=1 Tax=Zymobacter sp. IVIA_12111.31 C1 TaxID=3394854 RepID=UPI0039C1AA1F